MEYKTKKWRKRKPVSQIIESTQVCNKGHLVGKFAVYRNDDIDKIRLVGLFCPMDETANITITPYFDSSEKVKKYIKENKNSIHEIVKLWQNVEKLSIKLFKGEKYRK